MAVSCVIVAAVIVSVPGELFLLFILLSSIIINNLKVY